MTDELNAAAATFGLKQVGERPPFWSYLVEAWNRRSFAVTMARYQIQVDNDRNRLGILWVVIVPLLQATIYGLIFGVIMPSSSRPSNFIPFLIVGVFVFDYFSDSVIGGAGSVVKNSKLAQSIRFPRILLPVSEILQQAFQMLGIAVLLYVLIWVTGESPRWSWFGFPVLLAVMTLFNAGVGMISARISVHLRDFRQILPFILRILFYSTGIFYSLDKTLVDHPLLLGIAHFVPTYDFVSIARELLIESPPLDPVVWIVTPIWTVVVFVAGVVFFWQAEVRYGLDD